MFDTETSTDHTQRLKFGSYRFIVEDRCVKEALFFADDLSRSERRILENYVRRNQADVVEEGLSRLSLLNRSDLVKELFRLAYKGRCLLVGFNLPFDLSRIACGATNARKRFAGGFSLGLWSYIDENGEQNLDPYRPRIGIKHIDSKRALKGFTDRNEPDEDDRIPEGSTSGKPEEDYIFRGHLLDLRTLAFALTDRGYSLESACEAFDVEHGKESSPTHGAVTPQYIRYNRRDVQATSELAGKLLEEYLKHPIKLQPTKAYSPASIGKAYLRAMNIKPILERQPDFPKAILGYAQSAFYGGRTSAHIRRTAMPVVYTDFLSMYPTVNSLMGLWDFVTAREIKVVEHCHSEVRTFISQLNSEILFRKDTWKKLIGFVKILPDGDILPTRGRYTVASNDWQVAVNHLYGNSNDPIDALWYSIPDVVASFVLTGKVPKIVDAFRLEANGKAKGLQPVKLRGAIEIDPSQQDFFKVVIEERKRLASRTDLSERETERLDKALKVLANATSYGIYAEMHRLESDKKVQVTCHGIGERPFRPWVAHPDEPGAYCFPPLASLITGAARLMLGLLEHEVQKLNGTYAMEDTDSMAIVATEQGGILPCPGGYQRTSRGKEAVQALSWQQVQEISQRFALLNPYDGDAGRGSILKIESDNRDPKSGKPRQVYCFAISAKRYALFLLESRRKPVLLRNSCPGCGWKNSRDLDRCKKCKRLNEMNNDEDRWSEHGLGHLLNPLEPESEDREWIAAVWLAMIRKSLGLQTRKLPFEHLPAVGQISVSSPAVMRSLKQFNHGKKYSDQIKPFNFLLSCHVRAFGHPVGANPEQFHLISPYNSDSRQWLKAMWIDQYSGKMYRITTKGFHGTRKSARVKTYGDFLEEYEVHPESKCADATGNTCGKQTIGLLHRRHVRVDFVKYIGKESNSLEDVEFGVIHSAENVYTEYADKSRDEWQTKIVPILQKHTLAELQKITRLSRRTLIDARTGRRRPHPKNQLRIVSGLEQHRLI
ncbi:MAG TPA: hypothetical protein VFA90_02015 [Terriglobales bacterium]|nr:hypothetical protein [Terriglobales bacterium]